jgi:hypothetical protein
MTADQLQLLDMLLSLYFWWGVLTGAVVVAAVSLIVERFIK